MANRGRGATESRWRELIAEQERSGQSVADFAHSRGVPPASLYWWRSELRRRSRRPSSSPTIVPVTLISRAGEHDQSESFELVLAGGRRVRVPARFDAAALARLINVVEQAC